ncbi:hypothetical protein [Algibacter pectinivorans]|uniref:Uncharacterized protein n=1 Tax=Algibacter pectinivorans TaxID=870482 RepID=A0A1I1RZK8_9FLAO|nr:hypothetical protein [Algibacter pectinivorans]SFD39482.1 hypothetical protein SAMN04487987_11223 [Algibacter pectinivorans]
MQNSLFLLCPTDNLEYLINTVYSYDNYFYTSLGNTFSTDEETMKSLEQLILAKNISNIYFILSNENKIILDALESQYFKNIVGLKRLHKNIEKQKQHSKYWANNYSKHLLFSYYLNHKINKLCLDLKPLLLQKKIIIKGKIYNQSEDKFHPIYSNLICKEKFQFN